MELYHTTTAPLPAPIIGWQCGELRAAPRTSAPQKRETFYPVICPMCSSIRWLRKADALRAHMCATCQRSEAGKKGYQAATAKHGRQPLLDKIAAKERLFPSYPEFTVRRWLYDAGIAYQCQQQHGPYLIDLVVNGLAIEINGYWHLRTRASRDRHLESIWPGQILFLNADEVIDHPTTAKTRLFAFINGVNHEHRIN